MAINTIYSLSDPETGKVRYIGKTCNLNSRFANHIQRKTTHSHKSCWIQSLKKKGLFPIIEVIDEVGEDWEFWESYYISLYKSWGFNLTNLTSGGIGIKGENYSSELRQKMGVHLRKPVLQYDLENNFIKEWSCGRIVAISLKLQAGHISKVCNNERETCGKYKWKFKN